MVFELLLYSIKLYNDIAGIISMSLALSICAPFISHMELVNEAQLLHTTSLSLLYGFSGGTGAIFIVPLTRIYSSLPSKHSSWWRRLEYVLKMSVFCLRLQKTPSRRLQDEYVRLGLTSSEDVFNTSSRRLGQDQYIRLGHMSSRRLQDVLKTSSRCLQDIFKTSCKDIFKTEEFA